MQGLLLDGQVLHLCHEHTDKNRGSKLIADEQALVNIATNFGLKYPIKVYFCEDLEDSVGRHKSPTPEHPWHKILLLKKLDPCYANEVFWHEFGHCRQAEETEDFNKVYVTHNLDVGYEANRYEADSNKHSDQFRHITVILPF